MQITCFDRTGKEVKRVTSTDDGIVEDNEEGSPSASPNPSQGGENNAGGGNTGGDDEQN